MKVLHLASANRWTGAAAPAFAEVEALRSAGIEAHYAYVGGYKLEAKIGHHPFAHAVIEKAQNPASFARTVRAVGRLVDRYGFDVLHAHLSHDHIVALFAARGARVARTFHARRTLRRDPFTRSLISRTGHLFAINEEFIADRAFRGRPAVFTPPPVDRAFFRPDGANVRSHYGIAPDANVVAVIGKVSPGRGFELALAAFARIRAAVAGSRLLIIGHGPHRPALEELSRGLGIERDVIWAGYHEDDLPEHYRAADALLFTAAGSDEGHRAVLEAMACGVAPVTAPIEGIAALLRGFEGALIADDASPDAIAQRAIALLTVRDRSLRERFASHSALFGYEAAARRLVEAYGTV